MEGFSSDEKSTVWVILFPESFCRLLLLNFLNVLVVGVMINQVIFAEPLSLAAEVCC